MVEAQVNEFRWLDREEQRVFRIYARSTRALFVQFDRELEAEVGLPRTYFEVLWLLSVQVGGAMRMSDLAAATGSQPSRTSYTVAQLEKAGQVRREHCAQDRRGWYAVITEAGREMLERASPVYAALIRRYFFEPISAAQRQAIVAAGERILEELARSGSPALLAGVEDVAVREALHS